MDPEVSETTGSVDHHIAWAFAKRNHFGIRLKEQPLVEQRTPVKHDAARKLRAECFEPVATAWTGERDWLRNIQRIFHKSGPYGRDSKCRRRGDEFNTDLCEYSPRMEIHSWGGSRRID